MSILKTRNDILSKASYDCIRDLYKLAQPHVEWDDFLQQNIEYSEGEKCEPCPYEFYYLPKEVMKEICDSYVRAYKIDSQQELLDTIEILKNYCNEPIVDKYIEGELREDGTHWPGHRGYEHPESLRLNLLNLITDSRLNLGGNSGKDIVDLVDKIKDKFFEFLDMAGNFYNWNRELNSFNTTVYLGSSPSSNKEKVIENWKKYRNKDIEINDKEYEEWYDEE